MTVKKIPKLDDTIKRKGSNLTEVNYNFVFSDNIQDWINQKRVYAERVREKKLNPNGETKKKAYHRNMPSIGSQLING